MSRRAPNKGAKSSPKGICQPHRNVTHNTSLLVNSASRGTVYKTQPFGQLKQTLSKKLQKMWLQSFNCWISHWIGRPRVKMLLQVCRSPPSLEMIDKVRKNLLGVLPVWTVLTPQNYFQIEFEYTLSEQFLLYSYNMKSLRKSYRVQSAYAVFTLDFHSNVIKHFRLAITQQSTSCLCRNYFVQ